MVSVPARSHSHRPSAHTRVRVAVHAAIEILAFARMGGPALVGHVDEEDLKTFGDLVAYTLESIDPKVCLGLVMFTSRPHTRSQESLTSRAAWGALQTTVERHRELRSVYQAIARKDFFILVSRKYGSMRTERDHDPARCGSQVVVVSTPVLLLQHKTHRNLKASARAGAEDNDDGEGGAETAAEVLPPPNVPLNLHLPLHLPEVVEALGPLVRIWAFAVERLNRKVKVGCEGARPEPERA